MEISYEHNHIQNTLHKLHCLHRINQLFFCCCCCCLYTGFMTRYERKIFDDLKSPHLKYWVPFVWFGNLASKARKEGRIRDSVDLQTLMNVSRKSKSTEN